MNKHLRIISAHLCLIARAWKYRRRIDSAEIAKVIDVVRPGDVAIDIGAHKGAYTYWLARAVGSMGKVLAVEPQKELADMIRFLWQHRTNVEAHWAAVAEFTGEATLSVRTANKPSHGASILGFEDSMGAARSYKVPAITLSDLVTQHQLSRVDFIKCDTEGTEVQIFRGASDILRRYHPIVLCECEAQHNRQGSDNVGDLLSLFRNAGYEAQFFYGQRLVNANEFDAKRHQIWGTKPYGNNFLFTPRK